MTQKDLDNLKAGDVIFDIEHNNGYHITKIEEGHVEYEDTTGWGTIPTKHLLRWNYVSLMREREPVEWTEKDQSYLKTALVALTQIEYFAKAGLFVSEKLDPNADVLARVRATEDWLMALKPRKSTWKPSKEQMRALHEANIRACSHEYGYHLSTLEMDLEGKL